MNDPRQPGALKQEKQPRIEVYWTTVTYRTVAIYLLLIVVIVLAGFYLIHPEWYSDTLERMSRTLGATPTGADPIAQNQARFVNLDGKVEVKKVNSVNWETADYRTTLDKGDLVRTAADGAARITFVDGTTYTVKNDSFVTVEENSIDRDRSHQRRRAHQLRRGGPGHRHLGVAAVQGGGLLRQCARFAAGKQPRRGAQRSGGETRTRSPCPPARRTCRWATSKWKSASGSA